MNRRKPTHFDVVVSIKKLHLDLFYCLRWHFACVGCLICLEQNYRNDPITQDLLLSLNEGETIDFLNQQPGKPDQIVQGKIVRSG
jgi:hypothetical protein